MKQSELLKNISNLTKYQKEQLNRYILDMLQINDDLKHTKPSICPKCNKKTRIVKRGLTKSGKQRYWCKDCGGVFAYDTQTTTMNMKIPHVMFYQIALDTLNFVAIRDTAAHLGIPVKTVFFNRHKFLSSLEEILSNETMSLNGTVEVDETYVLKSEKGSRNKEKSRKRGGTSKYKGLSHEQVCIVTTTDRNGHEIFKAVGFGKPTSNSILENFQKRIENRSIIYADGAFMYDKLASKTNCKLINLKNRYAYNKVEHLNTVNNIHSLIQNKLTFYKGIATKYMNRYLALFTFVRRFLDMDDNEKSQIIIKTFKTYNFTPSYNSIKTLNLFM